MAVDPADVAAKKRFAAIALRDLSGRVRHVAAVLDTVADAESKRQAKTWRQHAYLLSGAAAMLDAWVSDIHREVGP